MNADSGGEYNEMLVGIAKDSTGEERRAALDLLCRKNHGLIMLVVNPFHGLADHDELEQEATLAMIHAVDSYDPEKGLFSTFAWNWMRNAIIKYLNYQEGRTLKISVSRYNQVLAYKKICEQYQQKYNRRPMDMESAALLDCSVETIEKIRNAMSTLNPRSLSEIINQGQEDNDDISLEDTIPDPRDRIGELEDEIQSEQLSAALMEMVNSELNDRERLVIKARYYDGKSLRQTSENLGGISHESVRNIEQKALAKMRRSRRGHELLEYLYSDGLKHTGVTSFLTTWTSATERTALRAYERKQKAHRAI